MDRDPTGLARCSGVSLACSHLAWQEGLWKKNHWQRWSSERKKGRQLGSALHLPGLSGGPAEFSSLSLLVCTVRGQIRWSLGSSQL